MHDLQEIRNEINIEAYAYQARPSPSSRGSYIDLDASPPNPEKSTVLIVPKIGKSPSPSVEKPRFFNVRKWLFKYNLEHYYTDFVKLNLITFGACASIEPSFHKLLGIRSLKERHKLRDAVEALHLRRSETPITSTQDRVVKPLYIHGGKKKKKSIVMSEVLI